MTVGIETVFANVGRLKVSEAWHAALVLSAVRAYSTPTWFLCPCQTKHFCLSDPLCAPDEPNTFPTPM
jgi:hypothetical protein